MATILAGMPELRRRFLDEHAPDARGRCRECRNEAGPEHEWPCVPYRIACEAQRIAEGGLPGPRLVPQVPAQTRSPLTSAVQEPLVTDLAPVRRLKAIPAASWQPRW
ncbi:hypothetical protein ACQEVB_17590 [Pseudonocardia sp. CA-107938]|uniref:hypothetical protein n=1 Tax=Pseudonocardia sp. CA-107938 TaxID=3240021 RepID=UPI003D92A999